MPIVRISRLEEESPKLIQRMLPEVKNWVASVKDLGIEPEDVKPIYSEIMQENPGEILLFEVIELFTIGLSGIARTKKMRKDLCISIETGFNEFLKKKSSFNVVPKQKVVRIYMADRDAGEIYQW